MTLQEKQAEFTHMIAKLIIFAYENGYQLTFGDCARIDRKGHMKNSLHYLRLAVDFNAFLNGKYLKKTEDYLPLGEFWESIGGAWGGRFNDGNHFSLEHNGYK